MAFLLPSGYHLCISLKFYWWLRYCSFRRKSHRWMICIFICILYSIKTSIMCKLELCFFMFSRIGYSKEKFSVECAVDCFPPKLFWHLCDNMNVKLHTFDAPTKIPPRFSYSHLWIFCFQRYHHSFIGIRPSVSSNIWIVMYYNWKEIKWVNMFFLYPRNIISIQRY